MNDLLRKLDAIRADPSAGTFILADARDADMAWGIPSFGESRTKRTASGPAFRSVPEFCDEIRQVVQQGVVDILLASTSTMDVLAHKERLFDNSRVTPAVRINDTTDVWCQRGARYHESPSAPFASSFIEEVQFGSLTAPREGAPVVNLGLYSMTFNNDFDADLRMVKAFREFRAYAERLGFSYFLEVLAPNVKDLGMRIDDIPKFVNDSIARSLAGVPASGRPLFLKIPYFGPDSLEDLVAYDPSMVVGILGGSSGTTYDAFKLIAEAQKHGARVALFGRKIKDAELPLAFIGLLRRITDRDVSPEEAVRIYHDDLQKAGISPRRPLAEDMSLTLSALSYASA